MSVSERDYKIYLFTILKLKATKPYQIEDVLHNAKFKMNVRSSLNDNMMEASYKKIFNFDIIVWLYENGCGNLETLNKAFHTFLSKNVLSDKEFNLFINNEARLPYNNIIEAIIFLKNHCKIGNYKNCLYRIQLQYNMGEINDEGETYFHYLLKQKNTKNTKNCCHNSHFNFYDKINPLSKKYIFNSIDYGVISVNSQDNDGNTILHCALNNEDFVKYNFINDIVFHIPFNHKTLKIKNKKNETPIDLLKNKKVQIGSQIACYGKTIKDIVFRDAKTIDKEKEFFLISSKNKCNVVVITE